MSKRWVRCLLAGAMLALTVGSAQAYVAFDNLNNADFGASQPGSIPVQTGYSPDTFDLTTTGNMFGQAFTATGPATLVDVVLRLATNSLYTQSTNGTLAVSVWDDTNAFTIGAPGTKLYDFTGTEPTSTIYADITFTAPANSSVTAGNTYWVVVSTTGDRIYDWAFNSPADQPYVLDPTRNAWYNNATAQNSSVDLNTLTFDNTVWDASNANDQPFQMQVDAVPEPSTYALLVISLGVVGYARKRMNNKE